PSSPSLGRKANGIKNRNFAETSRACLEQILSRTRIDRHGAYWPGSRRVRPPSAQFEGTLASGNAGILLALLRCLRGGEHPHEELSDVLAKGIARLRCRMEKQPFQHGLHGGTIGTWMLFAEVEGVLPELVEGWQEAARAQLAGMKLDGDLPCSLLEGVSGTLLGARMLEKDLFDALLLLALQDRLLAGAKPHPEGLFWDFNPTSLQPPVGLLSGNAGIDLALAPGIRDGSCASSILSGSLRYARSRFSNTCSNWPDFDASGALRAMDPADLERRIACGKAEALVGSIEPEDSIGWGMGTLGMLQSRAVLRRVFEDGPLACAANEDCGRAIDRLSRVDTSELDGLDTSILHGLGGLALGLRACRPLLAEDEWERLGPLWRETVDRLTAASPQVDNEDLSLFSGLAGHLYALLSLADEASSDCLAVLTSAGGAPPSSDPSPASIGPFLERRLPLCSSSPETRQALETLPCLSLSCIREAVATHGAESQIPDKLAEAREHELSLYEDIATCRFQDLLWRELGRQHDCALRYAEGMNAELLFDRFHLADTARLFAFEFDPFARPFTAQEETVFTLRQSTSGGVVEVKLTALQYGLLSAFRSEAVALRVIAEVVERVDSPHVSQRQLAEFSRNVIRGFLHAGYLVPAKAGTLRSWLDHKQARGVQQRLFPELAM
ncbi:MAG: lanthionine synthetase LanC family protein, partial [Verrucomicrobiota bacterium]